MNQKGMGKYIHFKLSIACAHVSAIIMLAAGILVLYGAIRYQASLSINSVPALLFILIALVFYGRGRSLRHLHPDVALLVFSRWELMQQLGILIFCFMILAMSIHRIFNEGYAVFG